MSEEQKGVKEPESPNGKTSESHSELGEASSKSDERTMEQVLAENRHKADLIKELREELREYHESKEERLEELQSKARLTAAEKEEMQTLEEQVASIKGDPRSRPWLKLNEEVSAKAADARMRALDAEYTEDYVSEIAEAEKIPYEKFEKEIVKYMKRVDPGAEMTTLRRAKKAYKLYKEERAYSEKMAELKEKEKQFAETSTRAPRPQSKAEILESSKTEKGLEQLLKGIHAVQDEATSR